MALVLQRPREFIFAHPEVILSLGQRIRFRRYSQKRAAGVPLAYLTGHKEFFGLDFLVNRSTLIPRPETETLVEAALYELKSCGCISNQIYPKASPKHEASLEPILIIDIGTGTGCIPIALLKNIPPECHEKVTTLAADSSFWALRLARQNALRRDVNINFVRSNLLAGISKPLASRSPEFVLITANLPYLTHEEYVSEPSLRAEPRSTLVGGGPDGLDLYRKLVAELADWQKRRPEILALTLIIEMNPEQIETMQKTIIGHFPKATVEIKLDLAGRARVMVAKI